jgi:hypothetical protein
VDDANGVVTMLEHILHRERNVLVIVQDQDPRLPE